MRLCAVLIRKLSKGGDSLNSTESLEKSPVTHSECYNKYVEKHGRHFTKELLEVALSELHKAVSYDSVEGHFKKIGAADISNAPDVAFLASHIRDAYNQMFDDEISCVNHAILLIADGLAHILFERWAAKHPDLDWSNYI